MPKPIPVYVVEKPNYGWLVWLVLVTMGLMILGKMVKLALIVGAVGFGVYALLFVCVFIRSLFAREKLSASQAALEAEKRPLLNKPD